MSEEIKYNWFDEPIINESELIGFFEDLNKQKPYQNPTDHMSQKQKQQFHSYLQESFKKAKEDGY